VVTSFLIVTLMLFIFNLFIALISIGNQYGSRQEIKVPQLMVPLLVLVLISWNILALASY
jgi:hypothetical protein